MCGYRKLTEEDRLHFREFFDAATVLPISPGSLIWLFAIPLARHRAAAASSVSISVARGAHMCQHLSFLALGKAASG